MQENTMCGSWQYQDMPDIKLPEPASTAFKKAFDGFVGISFVPVLYVASQVVMGINYCIICKTTTMTNPPMHGCRIVRIYADIQGNAHVTGIEDIIK